MYEDQDKEVAYLFHKEEGNFNSDAKVRFGLPLWVPWNPSPRPSADPPGQGPKSTNPASTTIPSRMTADWVCFNLLTMGCNVTLRTLTKRSLQPSSLRTTDIPSGNHTSPTHSSSSSAPSPSPCSLRAIELEFTSVKEARARVGMLMLSCYDEDTKNTLVLHSEKDMMKRLQNRVEEVAWWTRMLQQPDKPHQQPHQSQPHQSQPLQNMSHERSNIMHNGSNILHMARTAHAPVETFVHMGEPSGLFHRMNNTTDVNDYVRFRVMIEMLSFQQPSVVEGG